MIEFTWLKKLFAIIKGGLAVIGVTLILANFAVAEFWLYEMIGLNPHAYQMPDFPLFMSILVFFVIVAAFFLNRLQAILFSEVRA